MRHNKKKKNITENSDSRDEVFTYKIFRAALEYINQRMGHVRVQAELNIFLHQENKLWNTEQNGTSL
jgi:hypothetical protein